MDYKTCGNIFKGLAQTGAWGCFDEFNRITVEVLSVIAVQVKCIQDGIKAKTPTFDFMGEIIPMSPTVGYFITMNPGYAGRAELPENLKVSLRSVLVSPPTQDKVTTLYFEYKLRGELPEISGQTALGRLRSFKILRFITVNPVQKLIIVQKFD